MQVVVPIITTTRMLTTALHTTGVPSGTSVEQVANGANKTAIVFMTVVVKNRRSRRSQSRSRRSQPRSRRSQRRSRRNRRSRRELNRVVKLVSNGNLRSNTVRKREAQFQNALLPAKSGQTWKMNVYGRKTVAAL